MYVLWFFETKAVIKRQRRYRTQYERDPPSDKAVRRRLKQLQETGSVLHGQGAGRQSTSQEDVERIQEVVFSKPTKINQTSFIAVRYTTKDCLEGGSF
jgi:hypothetical protein